MTMVTIFELLQDLRDFTAVDQEDLDRAAKSDVTDQNNAEFDMLLQAWQNGSYDNDPDILVQRLIALI